MQSPQDFYRALASDAAVRALLRIRNILADETLSDETCFQKIEAIVTLLEELGVDAIVEIGPGKALSAFVKKTENMRLVPDWAYKLVIGERTKI